MNINLITFIYTLAIIVTLVGAQCIGNSAIEILVDDQLRNSTVFYLHNNERLVVGCRRCNIKKEAPNWFYFNHTIIQSCDNASELQICTQSIGTIKYLEFLSFQESLAGEYRCASKGRINVQLGEFFSYICMYVGCI